MDFTELIRACDTEIRQGHSQVAAKRLRKVLRAHILRKWKLPIAKIARRTGLYTSGLKILADHVFNEGDASPSEIAEYSILLMRAGAVTEGLDLISAVDAGLIPEVPLYRAFGHFARWEYAEAIPHVESYLNAPLNNYARLVGEANLTLALVECRQFEKARALITKNIASTAEQNHHQLQANYRALLAQVHIEENDFPLARAELAAARELFPLLSIHDHFMVAKMSYILDALERRDLVPLAALREAAIQRCDWVALREADAFALRIEFDEALFQRLIFGTPYASFRDRLFREFARQPQRNTFVLGPKSAPRFDILSGTIDGRLCPGAGSKSHQLVEVLLRDFYEPMRIASLFGSVFFEEHYNAVTSPTRVRQLIRRTRQWLAEQQLPVALDENGGFYSLRLVGRLSFRIPLQRKPIDTDSINLERIKSAVGTNRPFSNRDVRDLLKLSTAASQTLLNNAIVAGRIERVGSSKRDTLYILI